MAEELPTVIYVAHKKNKKMVNSRVSKAKKQAKKPAKKKPSKVTNPSSQPEGKKDYTWAEMLHTCLIFLRTSFLFVV